MSFIDALRRRFIRHLQRPIWKTVASVGKTGRVLMDDGTVARLLSPVNLKAGDQVLVYMGQILRFKWEDTKFVPIPIIILPLIICHVGDTTGDYIKKYYNLIGTELVEITNPTGWSLIDDGAYGTFIGDYDNDDIWQYNGKWELIKEYGVYGDGLRVPYGHGGIASKLQNGNTARYILNQSIESEIFRPINLAWFIDENVTTSLSYIGSLIGDLYSYYDSKPFITRYTNEGIIRLDLVWSGYDATMTYRIKWNNIGGDVTHEEMFSNNFRDVYPTIKNIHKIKYAGNEISNIIKTPIRQFDYTWKGLYINYDYPAIVGVKQANKEEENQEIIRAVQKLYDWTYDGIDYVMSIAEPHIIEKYNADTGEFIEVTDTFDRCSDCYQFIHEGIRLLHNPPKGTIPNDITIPYALTYDDKLTYIRLQKDGQHETPNPPTEPPDFAIIETRHKSGIYCADELVEESEWEDAIIVPTGDCTMYWSDFPIRKTNYRIVHAHHDENFNFVLYRKETFLERKDVPIYRELPGGSENLLRATAIQIKANVEYKAWINGKITTLPYSCIIREYILYKQAAAWWMHPYPWFDVSYDENGNLLSDEYNNNSAIVRIFTTATKNELLFSYDVFPIKFRHTLQIRDYDPNPMALTVEYDSTAMEYPPASDARYPIPKDRKWLLFDKSGNYNELTPPQVNRINGLCLLGKGD